jgi:hypothetical protein
MALDLSRLSEIASTFETNIDPMVTLIGSGAWIAGAILVVYSISKLPSVSESRGGGGGKTYFGLGVGVLLGVMMMYMPALLDTMRETMFASETSPLSKASSVTGLGADMSKIFLTLLRFIQVIGILAVIRSLFIFNKMANGGGHDASWGKGLTFLIGGSFAANIVLTANMFFTTFGLTYKIV